MPKFQKYIDNFGFLFREFNQVKEDVNKFKKWDLSKSKLLFWRGNITHILSNYDKIRRINKIMFIKNFLPIQN